MSKIFYNTKGRVIGELTDKGNYRKRVEKEKHFMRVLNAYGVDEDVIRQLDGKCENIVILEDDKLLYVVKFEVFKKKRFVKNFDTEQRFLPMKYWDVYEGKTKIKEGERDLEDVQAKLL